ncbi:DNA mismatch endonuclease Vsr [Roseibacterium beibuensis]|uniref:DNA mismatch endonuclease Vsr n=2 Tax=[Roseibacterium] beibuensis TaxID=1193142 RepID=A0ABP9L530_9RHOB
MAKVRSQNTKPELAVRRYLHARGLRFRLHRRDLPGKPDMVFPSRRVAVFVHGCFWHQHPGCRRAKLPQTRADFWREKLEANVRRDAAALAALEILGWTALVVWECEIEGDALEELYQRIQGSSIHK